MDKWLKVAIWTNESFLGKVQMIKELLKYGKENITTTEELMQLTKINDTREIQWIVQKERQDGAVILSTCGNGGGYWLPNTESELKEFIKSMNKRKSEIDKSTESARKLLREMQIGKEINK